MAEGSDEGAHDGSAANDACAQRLARSQNFKTEKNPAIAGAAARSWWQPHDASMSSR